MKRNVLIAGLGLIGGSLAKAVKLNDHNYLIGYDIDKETLNYALEQEIVNEVEEDFEKAVLKSDIIILASPISATIQLMKKMDQFPLEKNVIVSDVSSVKGSVLQ